MGLGEEEMDALLLGVRLGIVRCVEHEQSEGGDDSEHSETA